MTDRANSGTGAADPTEIGGMDIGAYLAGGGKLSAPENAPPRYRAELLRLMATVVDSEMAGASGFADVINSAPGLEARIAAARITAEKFAHAGRVLALMGDFGADTSRYADHHPWSARLARDADPGTARQGSDRRLTVFHYPLAGWVDAVVMNVLMGHASLLRRAELTELSYQPLAEVFRAILPVETRHATLGEAGLRRIIGRDGGREAAQASVHYWAPRVAASFGDGDRPETLRQLGLRRTSAADLQARWRDRVGQKLAAIGLSL